MDLNTQNQLYNNPNNNNYQNNQVLTNNNYMNGGKGGMVNNQFVPNPPVSTGNVVQGYWNNNPNNYSQQPQQMNMNEKEYILLDGSTPNKKRKYVFVEEVDVSLPIFSLDDIRKIISDEFDRRFGEEK